MRPCVSNLRHPSSVIDTENIMIICIAIPYFAAQIERRDDQRLASTPLAIGGQPWETQPIFAFSAEVARRGVRPGIPLRQAHLLAPSAHFMPAHQTHYQAVSGEMSTVVGDFSNRVETADWWRTPDQTAPAIGRRLPAHCFATLDDMPAADALPFSQQLGRTVRAETSLAPCVGIAPHKFTAQIAASLARPHHIRPVEPEAEQAFLAACPLRFLLLDKDTGRRLHLLGIRTLGDLAALAPAAVQTQFGREVARWQRWARGQDETPVRQAPAERAEMVTYRFDDPLTSLVNIDHLIQQAAQTLAARLQAGALHTRSISLAWQTERDQQRQQTQRLHQPTAAANRLSLALTHLFDPESLADGLTELTVSLSDLIPAVPQQLSLFGPPTGSVQGDELLYSVASRYPDSRFYRPALAANGHPLPERRFQFHPAGSPSPIPHSLPPQPHL
jgi:DNA polymerase IV